MTTIEQVRALLAEKPEAAQAIAAQFGEPEKVKAALLRFAADNGISLSDGDFEAMAAQARADGVLGEAELAQVAGAGNLAGIIALSILTLGIGCAIVSAVGPALPTLPGNRKQNCGEMLSGQ